MKPPSTRVVLRGVPDLRICVRIVDEHDSTSTHSRPPNGELVAHVVVLVERVDEENVDFRRKAGRGKRCRVAAVSADEVPQWVSRVSSGARGIDVNAPDFTATLLDSSQQSRGADASAHPELEDRAARLFEQAAQMVANISVLREESLVRFARSGSFTHRGTRR